MKTLIAVMITSLVLSAPAWAGAGFSISVDTRGAGPAVRGQSAVWGHDPGKVVAYRHRDREARQERYDRRIDILDQRLGIQRQRIRQGQASGRLTPAEARRLWTGFQRIEHYSQVAFADRWLSHREWQNLTVMLDRSDKEIYRLKNNRRSDDAPRWRF